MLSFGDAAKVIKPERPADEVANKGTGMQKVIIKFTMKTLSQSQKFHGKMTLTSILY